MNDNYLKSTQELLKKGYLDYCTSSNYDEDFAKYFPSLSSKRVFELVSEYPDDNYQSLAKKIITKFELKRIALGAGSEDLILRICQTIKDRQWKTGVVTPTFYRITDNLKSYATISNGQLEDYDYKKLDLVWLVNPNPLTGSYIQKHIINGVLRKNPQTLFVIDETAIFLLKEWQKVSFLRNSNKQKNLLVITSFSKFHNLSGLRLGFATGNKEILSEIQARGLTFPISRLTCEIAENFIFNEFLEDIRNRIARNKKIIKEILLKNPNIEVKKSDTNCIFCRLKDGRNLYKELLGVGIISLNLDTQIGVEKKGWIRLTAHSSKMKHKRLIECLNKLVSTL